MKLLRELQAGDKFRYAKDTTGEVYMRGGKVGGSDDMYYIQSTVNGCIYMVLGSDVVIIVEG